MFVQKCVVPAAVAVDALVVAALVVVVPIDILTVVDVAAAAGAMLETLDDTVLAPSAVLTAGMTLVDPALEVTEVGDVVVSKLRNAVVSSAPPPPPPPPPPSSPVSGWGRDVCAPPFVLLV